MIDRSFKALADANRRRVLALLRDGDLAAGDIAAHFDMAFPSVSHHWLGYGLGALFVVMGNVLPRVRPNWMFRIRTPWTLLSDRAWSEAQRMGGNGLVVVGTAVFVVSALHPANSSWPPQPAFAATSSGKLNKSRPSGWTSETLSINGSFVCRFWLLPTHCGIS